MATLFDILAQKGHQVISVQTGETVLGAARLMNERGIGGVVVLDQGELVGMFTERDVLRRVVAQGLDPSTTTVARVMSSPVVSGQPHLSVEDCAALMTARRVRHLPVLDPSGLIGVVTIGDILAHQVREQQTTIAQMNSYLFDLR